MHSFPSSMSPGALFVRTSRCRCRQPLVAPTIPHASRGSQWRGGCWVVFSSSLVRCPPRRRPAVTVIGLPLPSLSSSRHHRLPPVVPGPGCRCCCPCCVVLFSSSSSSLSYCPRPLVIILGRFIPPTPRAGAQGSGGAVGFIAIVGNS
jgi:hypothetical protein